MALNLPAELSKDGQTRTAASAGEYWDLVYRGFSAEAAESDLTPQEKAARTRAANKASQKPDENPDAQAGDAQTV